MVVMDMDVLDTKTNTKTKTNTTCFKDPMYAIFLKISGFKDIKYDMDIRVSHFGVIFPNHLASGRDECLSHSGTRNI